MMISIVFMMNLGGTIAFARIGNKTLFTKWIHDEHMKVCKCLYNDENK